MSLRIRVKRIYDAPSDEDGYRVLIDRLWPRGIRKEAARLDAWKKALAPSTELRKRFAHDPAKFEDFTARYRLELEDRQGAIEELRTAVIGDTLTLVYAAADSVHNHAVVLRDYLQEYL
ncbi:MAG: DUF488 family protein [Phycisphaerales bacterium]